MTTDAAPTSTTFADLNLPSPLMAAIAHIGYESPSPIQAATIPPLLAGRDVLGQAQTGTGKTAAFALPILARIDPARRGVQALVLTPTRELAIQVAEAFQKYASQMPGFAVLPVYGGQSYGPQLSALQRGVQVVVATPGRTIDHLERGSLKLDTITTVVLDEADEMLRMGFIDDVETILKATPPERQVALFSATMPPQIKRIASTYLRDPAEVTIAARTRTATTVRQRVWMVSGVNKLDALTRILEVERFEAMLIFARTKVATEELAERLAARGFTAAALNGDIPQPLRERVVNKLRDGSLDIVVATDVAARGLDVERITHVVNYDVPTDTESYVHRIGRTGRAGRSGEAILFVAPRERGLLKMIERATRQPIENFVLPSPEAVSRERQTRFKQRIAEAIGAAGPEFEAFRNLLAGMEAQDDTPAIDLAAALATLVQGQKPLFAAVEEARGFEPAARPTSSSPAAARKPFSPPRAREGASSYGAATREVPTRRDGAGAEGKPFANRPRPVEARSTDAAKPEANANAERTPISTGAPMNPFTAAAETPRPQFRPRSEESSRAAAAEALPRAPRFERAERPARSDSAERTERPARAKPGKGEMETYRLEVGHQHQVKPGNIVGAIANEAELDSAHIGRIDIRDDHTLIELPAGMPKHIFKLLQGVWVSGQRLAISKAEGEAATGAFEGAGRGPRPKRDAS